MIFHQLFIRQSSYRVQFEKKYYKFEKAKTIALNFIKIALNYFTKKNSIFKIDKC